MNLLSQCQGHKTLPHFRRTDGTQAWMGGLFFLPREATQEEGGFSTFTCNSPLLGMTRACQGGEFGSSGQGQDQGVA